VRQLQRHVQQQNTTLQERVQQVRFMLATEYLKDPHLGLQEIALLLCYAEQSAIERAVKHWTKQTPQQWGDQFLSKE
ncbi:helix-turn-helix domain-containing protein, partial [Acinetobacter baumannii]|uniref:helix-turn-helix domain-containing protein n=1 Tax=Acinetobacter baumannii TaxID=470 RepID=UPI001111D740